MLDSYIRVWCQVIDTRTNRTLGYVTERSKSDAYVQACKDYASVPSRYIGVIAVSIVK